MGVKEYIILQGKKLIYFVGKLKKFGGMVRVRINSQNCSKQMQKTSLLSTKKKWLEVKIVKRKRRAKWPKSLDVCFKLIKYFIN